MSEKSQVLSLLNLISETCAASKAALSQAETPQTSSSSDLDSSLAVLRNDFTSILTILYTLTTKVSLTLRATEAAPSAALPQLKDIVKYISSLTTCATLFEPHGKTLSEEVRRCAIDVLGSLRAYADVFTEIVNRGEGSAEDYLVQTDEVHDTIDAARRHLPEDNAAAVSYWWSGDREMVEESLADVQSMIEDDESDVDEGLNVDEDFDDESYALGFGPTTKLSPLELARVKKIHPLLRMVALLHKRILLGLLKNVPSTVPSSILDKLPSQSNNLLLTIEDVVADLYAPQDVTAVQFSIIALAQFVSQLRAVILDEFIVVGYPTASTAEAIDALTKAFDEASISGKSTRGKEADVRRWFNTCFEQIAKLSQTIIASLDAESTL